MNKTKPLVLLSFIIMMNCETQKNKKTINSQQHVEVQGHRGDRGNLPENTIAGFLSALHKGVDVLELDVVISKDKKVVVSHEPYMSSVYISTPSDSRILKSEEKRYNLYTMTYDSIKSFVSGLRGNINFPEQLKQKAHKPLLSEVFKTIENDVKAKHLHTVNYNIELKSQSENYGIYQPHPAEFISLVMQVIQEMNLEDRIILQSFDPNLLNIAHTKYPHIKMSYLVANSGIEKNLKLLHFKPQIYSPNFKLLKDKKTVDSIKNLEMKLIPWTVNRKEDIYTMFQLHVDGIITDYPERVMEVLQCHSKTQ